ncbi:hypothetical protein LNTAR_19392 [Lentisphaera araneosa HTCC2155]|uniref:Plasmid stabilization system n=1 Tax=Lentisphaera araneosa HTCC2155 TaxID=313628 RepID=A6DQU4_9BACT|nr:type II toxin-antitoxin system RelE/ParE family toxin [Lentisphaera araneosa]EDM25994.1 hypothetical protein LNTAR_19392 [Lentisphaera araneosa HTCC2155]
MAEIRWSTQASEDVEAIAEFIARDSEFYAKIFVTELFNTVERLETFPESGRMIPEFEVPNIREIILGNYRIIYRIEKERPEILTIHHSSQLFNKSLNGLRSTI